MRRYVVCLLAALAVPTASSAQIEGVFDMGMLTMDAAMSHVEQHEEGRAGRQATKPPARNRAARPQPRPSQALAGALARQTRGESPSAPAALSGAYRPSPAARAQVIGVLTTEAEQRAPGSSQEMRSLVDPALQEYARFAPTVGYKADDAVDALAFFLMAQWAVATDYRPDVTRAQAAGVRQQAAQAYAAVAGQMTTDAQRQQFAEVLVVKGALIASIHTDAVKAGDEAAVARYVAMTRRSAQGLFAMDPTRLALTDQGFRAK